MLRTENRSSLGAGVDVFFSLRGFDLCDLSQGGIGLIGSWPLPKGFCVKLKIKLADVDEPFEIEATVVWSDSGPDEEGNYRSGLSFLSRDGDSHRLISTLSRLKNQVA